MKLLPILATVGLASASAPAGVRHIVRQPAGFLLGRGLRVLDKRQNTCKANQGATTCEEYCGSDWRMCARYNSCYNPQLHICCSTGWHCNKGQYCIPGNRCCLNGLTPEQCGVTESVGTISEPATTGQPNESTSLPQAPPTITTATPAPPPSPVPTTPAPPPSSAPTNVGAIAGGVVGGVAVIGLILLGIIFLRRRRIAHSDAQPIQGQNNTATWTPPISPQQPVSLVEPIHNPVISSYQSERLQSTGSPVNTAVSPASKGGWTSPSPAPLYEAPGNEQLIHQPAYEVEGGQSYEMSRY